MKTNLFVRWFEIETKSGKSFKQILEDINSECGTKYRHNWHAKMASRDYSIERLPIAVRRSMMRKVLKAEFIALGFPCNDVLIDDIVLKLT